MEIMGRVKGRPELSRKPCVMPHSFPGKSDRGVEDGWVTELGKEIAVGREPSVAPNDHRSGQLSQPRCKRTFNKGGVRT